MRAVHEWMSKLLLVAYFLWIICTALSFHRLVLLEEGIWALLVFVTALRSVQTQLISSCECLQVIVMGAEQNGLPEDYQEKLRAIKTNLYEGPLPVMAEVERARKKAQERPSHCHDD